MFLFALANQVRHFPAYSPIVLKGPVPFLTSHSRAEMISDRGVERFMDNIDGGGSLNRGKVVYSRTDSRVGARSIEARSCEGGSILSQGDPARCPQLPETTTAHYFRHSQGRR